MPQNKDRAHNEPFIRVINIRKSFGSVVALDGVNLDFYRGEVTAIVGDNGAGKSTLIKVISGVLSPDGGKLIVNRKSYNFLTPSQAIELGISTVYQDLALVDCRDVATNIFLGQEPLKAGLFVDKKKMNRESEKLLNRLKVHIPSVTTAVEFLSGGQRQGVAVARSINQRGKMIIFDEPTAAMGVKESARVLELIRSLGSDGFAVVVISHNLHHVFSISNRICVLRNGRMAGDFRAERTSPNEIVGYITGTNELNTEVVKRGIFNHA